MSRWKIMLSCLAAAVAAHASVQGQEAGAMEPVHYRLDAISTDQFESHPAFDPLTGDLYFVRSSPQFQGWRLMRSRCAQTGWGPPEPAPFSGPGVEADPFFTPNGRRVYFISSRPDPPAKTADDLDIWMAERGRDGAWSAPMRLPAPVNSDAAEWFPRLDADGRLYFGSARPGGHGQTDIYVARQQRGRWEVRNLDGEISTAADDYEFEPAPDGSFGVLMSDGQLFRIERNNGAWGRRSLLFPNQSGLHVGPLLSPSGLTLLFARRAPQLSGELFRLNLGGRAEAWPRACPPR